MTPKQPLIFISYRRADSSEPTTRLYDRLVYAFGRDSVFKDVDTLQRGDDFPDVLRDWVSRCDVFLAMIGPRWLLVQDEDGRRRIDNPKDWVRQETVLALERGNACIVIPTLVEQASLPDAQALPKALAKLRDRNGHVLRPEVFHDDASALIAFIRQRFGLTAPKPTIDPQRAYKDLVDVMKSGSYDAARDIIVALRAQGSLPAHMRLDAIEQQLYRKVSEAQRDEQYDSVRQTAELVRVGILPPDELMAALEAFWQNFDTPPRYDPDALELLAKPSGSRSVTTTLPTSPPPSPAASPLPAA